MTDLPLSFTVDLARRLHAGRMKQSRRPAHGLFDRLKPGDRLWVREPFHLPERFEDVSPTQAFKMGAEDLFFSVDGDIPSGFGRRRFARELPRVRHRAHLVISATKRERLQALTEADAIAEGYESRAAFIAGWDAIHGAGKYTIGGARAKWADNCDVVVLTFNRKAGPLT